MFTFSSPKDQTPFKAYEDTFFNTGESYIIYKSYLNQFSVLPIYWILESLGDNNILTFLMLQKLFTKITKCFISKKKKKNTLTLTLLDLTKSYKNYLQNTQHVVLRNRPTLPIGTERLACLNSPRGVQLVTLA